MEDELYKYAWVNECSPGYVVYCHSFDLKKCTLKQGALAHKTAEFVTEAEAKNYCDYRNFMLEKHSTDAVDSITEYV